MMRIFRAIFDSFLGGKAREEIKCISGGSEVIFEGDSIPSPRRRRS